MNNEEKQERRFVVLYKLLGMASDKQNRVFENFNNRIINLEKEGGIYDDDLLGDKKCQNLESGKRKPKKP